MGGTPINRATQISGYMINENTEDNAKTKICYLGEIAKYFVFRRQA